MSPLEDIPRPALWKRFLLGAVLIIFATASAASVAAFREVDKIVNALEGSKSIAGVDEDLAKVDPGAPQTIMLLGSDRRPDNATDGGAGTGARSDTIILVRLDPDKNATALMSLPRDLKVEIPGRGIDKINAAYDYGGPKLTLRTVKKLTGLSINHVVNVDFKGFQKAIDAIGCIYVDVDRRYYNDSAEFAFINLYPGYQKLCGQKALEFARFRHEDSDLVRGARQQNLLREAKQQVGVGNLIEDRDRLIRIFGKYTTSDAALKNRAEILSLLKLAVYSVDQPVREVQFKGEITAGDEATGTPSYVVASQATVKRLADQFLGLKGTPGPRPARPGRKPRSPRGDGGLFKEPNAGMEQAVGAIQQGAGGKLPVFFPTVFVKGSSFVETPRTYRIRTPGGKVEKAYRMVIARNIIGEYYGVQGTTWKEPPILEGASEERKFGKRTFNLHYDGDRVRLVSWRTDKGVYWVSNTLLLSLSGRQMVSIARSTRLP